MDVATVGDGVELGDGAGVGVCVGEGVVESLTSGVGDAVGALVCVAVSFSCPVPKYGNTSMDMGSPSEESESRAAPKGLYISKLWLLHVSHLNPTWTETPNG